MNSDVPHRGWFRVANLHQELDRLSKSGDSLAGFFEGPNVFHASFAIPLCLPNDTYMTKSVMCLWLSWRPMNLCRLSSFLGLKNTCQWMFRVKDKLMHILGS